MSMLVLPQRRNTPLPAVGRTGDDFAAGRLQLTFSSSSMLQIIWAHVVKISTARERVRMPYTWEESYSTAMTSLCAPVCVSVTRTTMASQPCHRAGVPVEMGHAITLVQETGFSSSEDGRQQGDRAHWNEPSTYTGLCGQSDETQ